MKIAQWIKAHICCAVLFPVLGPAHGETHGGGMQRDLDPAGLNINAQKQEKLFLRLLERQRRVLNRKDLHKAELLMKKAAEEIRALWWSKRYFLENYSQGRIAFEAGDYLEATNSLGLLRHSTSIDQAPEVFYYLAIARFRSGGFRLTNEVRELLDEYLECKPQNRMLRKSAEQHLHQGNSAESSASPETRASAQKTPPVAPEKEALRESGPNQDSTGIEQLESEAELQEVSPKVAEAPVTPPEGARVIPRQPLPVEQPVRIPKVRSELPKEPLPLSPKGADIPFSPQPLLSSPEVDASWPRTPLEPALPEATLDDSEKPETKNSWAADPSREPMALAARTVEPAAAPMKAPNKSTGSTSNALPITPLPAYSSADRELADGTEFPKAPSEGAAEALPAVEKPVLPGQRPQVPPDPGKGSRGSTIIWDQRSAQPLPEPEVWEDSKVSSPGRAVDLETLPSGGGATPRILLHFWAAWCAPCIHELPALMTYLRSERFGRFKDRGVESFLVTVDDFLSTGQSFLEARNLGGVELIHDPDYALLRELSGRVSVPRTIVLDGRSGVVLLELETSEWSSEEVLGNIEKVLKTKENPDE